MEGTVGTDRLFLFLRSLSIMGKPRPTHVLPVGYPRAILWPSIETHGLPMGYPWANHARGLPKVYPRAPPMSNTWASNELSPKPHGMPMGCPWDAHGMPMGCP